MLELYSEEILLPDQIYHYFGKFIESASKVSLSDLLTKLGLSEIELAKMRITDLNKILCEQGIIKNGADWDCLKKRRRTLKNRFQYNPS